MDAPSPSITISGPDGKPIGGEPLLLSEQSDATRTAEASSADQQYLRDLETLERIEGQHAYFFDEMGELAARRGS
jgi:hypothetical protein